MPSSHDPYAVLRFPSYRYFVLGRIFYVLASEMQTVAVSWQIFQRLKTVPHQAALALGYIGLVQVIPVILLALPAGQVADRFSRRTVVMTTQLLFAMCAAALLYLSVTDAPVAAYYVVLFFAGIGRAFTNPAVSALYASLVPRKMLANASTWNSTAFQTAAMLGPAVGGLVIAVGGARLSYELNLACAAVSFALFIFVAPRQRIVGKREPVTIRSLLSGVRFVFGTRLLLAMLTLDLFAVLLGGASALLPIFASEILHAGATGFGLLRAAPALGAILMALLTAHLKPWRHAGPALLWTVAGYGVATLIFGCSHWLWLSVLALFLTGVFDNVSVIIRQTTTQSVTPNELRGRVTAVSFIFISCSNELGEFESGVTAALLGPVGSVVLGALGTLAVVAGAVRLFPELMRLGRLHELAPVRLQQFTDNELIEEGR